MLVYQRVSEELYILNCHSVTLPSGTAQDAAPSFPPISWDRRTWSGFWSPPGKVELEERVESPCGYLSERSYRWPIDRYYKIAIDRYIVAINDDFPDWRSSIAASYLTVREGITYNFISFVGLSPKRLG